MSTNPSTPENDADLSGLGRALLETGGSKPSSGPWVPPTAEELGKLLPEYDIVKMLGRGGMGAVYMGRQKSLDRAVAIKILSTALEDADPSFAERFKNEARAMGKLNHPGVVAVYDFGEADGGLLYIVMEYVEGTDVARMIAKEGRLHTEHAMAITAHVCDALAYAHERGIIHRDIKPANIMVGYDGVVKVADFGLAKMTHSNSSGLTQSGMAMGTLHYMAPEALMLGSSVDHRADIYAVGVMLYQMLTGKFPQGMFKMPSLIVPGIDPRYDGIIAKAIMEDRDERYPEAFSMRLALDGIVTQPVVKVEAHSLTTPAALPTEARPQRPGGQPPRPPQSRMVQVEREQPQQRSFTWLWVLLFAFLAGGVWFFKTRQPQQPPQVVISSKTEPATPVPPPVMPVTPVTPPKTTASKTPPRSAAPLPAPDPAPAKSKAMVTTPQQQPTATPTPMPTQPMSFGEHRYQFVPGVTTCTEADARAQEMGGHLARVETLAEHVWLVKTFAASLAPEEALLIDGSQGSTDARWSWRTGVAVERAFWLPGEPNSADQPSYLTYQKAASGYIGWSDLSEADLRWKSSLKGFVLELGPESSSAATASLWIDSKNRKLKADFVWLEGDRVHLRVAGKVTPVSMATLSAASQQIARALAAAAPPAGPSSAVVSPILNRSQIALDLSVEDDAADLITLTLEEKGPVLLKTKPGRDIVLDCSSIRDGAYHIYYWAKGCAVQWAKLDMLDGKPTLKSKQVKLYRLRYVIMKSVFNTSGSRELTGPDAKEELQAFTHLSSIHSDARIMQNEAKYRPNAFGDTPWLDTRMYNSGFGFLKTNQSYDSMTNAPDTGYVGREIEVVKGLTLYFRHYAGGQNRQGYGKLLIEDITDTPPPGFVVSANDIPPQSATDTAAAKTRLTTDPNAIVVSISSADGSKFAFTPESSLLLERPAADAKVGIENELAISPDGRWIATADSVGITLWRTGNLTPVAQKSSSQTQNLHFSADSKQLRFAGQKARRTVWDILEAAGGSVTLGQPGAAEPISPHTLNAASQNGHWEATTRSDESFSHHNLWQDGKIVTRIERQRDPHLVEKHRRLLSPDGKWGAYGCVTIKSARGPGFLFAVHFDDDNKRTMLSQKACHAHLAISPDSRWLVGGEDADYVIWDTKTWKQVIRLPAGLSENVRGSAAFSPDGRLLALQTENGQIRLLHSGKWDEVLTLTPPQQLPIERMTFSPDGRHLYSTGDKALRRWDISQLHAELKTLGIGW
jgi:serine/threonine protein kinase/WD40 repeat protein